MERWVGQTALDPAAGQLTHRQLGYDDWLFPQGTKLWKEFALEDRRLETRLLAKLGPGPRDWTGAAYVWLADGSDALLATEGVDDIVGTEHDAPSARQCVGCHAGRRSNVLGFSAIQLAEAGPNAPLDLDTLVQEGVLSHAPEQPIAVPGNAVDKRALGYLHANCGNCHNRRRPEAEGPRCYDPRSDIDFWLSVNELGTARETGSYRSVVPGFVTPSDPDASRVVTVVARRGMFLHMPPLGSERVDTAGVALLRSWIAQMPERVEP